MGIPAELLLHRVRKVRLPSDLAIEAYNLFGNPLAPGTDAPGSLHYLQTANSAAWLVEQLGQ